MHATYRLVCHHITGKLPLVDRIPLGVQNGNIFVPLPSNVN